MLRNVNSGAFEVYDIANNQLIGAASLGAVGLDWQLDGFAAEPRPHRWAVARQGPSKDFEAPAQRPASLLEQAAYRHGECGKQSTLSEESEGKIERAVAAGTV